MDISDPLIGKTLGNYRILGCLGKGGMGAVYLGEHPEIQSRVAIKVLHSALISNPKIVARFMDEARAVNRIGHAGIVQIHDCDRADGVGVYLVMELLAGRELDEVRQESFSFTAKEVAQVIGQAASALDASHKAGIIHRDLKPANIFLVPDPDMPAGVRVKILDFGIAKLMADQNSTSGATQTGTTMGTPLYMSPEQCLDTKNVDGRTDIYSLGVIAYELMCNQLPFRADSLGQLVLQHQAAEPPPLEVDDARLTAELASVIYKALAKEPEDRFDDMAQFREAMVTAAKGVGPELDQRLGKRAEREIDLAMAVRETVLGTEDTVAAPSETGGSITGDTATAETVMNDHTTLSASRGEAMPTEPPRRTGAMVGVALAVVAALVVVYFGFLQGPGSSGPPAAVTPAAAPAAKAEPPAPRRPAAPPPAAAKVAAPAPSAAPAAPQEVKITLDLEPTGARALLDGAPVKGDHVMVPRTGKRHTITVEADGHDAEKREFVADASQTLIVALDRSSPRKRRGKKKRRQKAGKDKAPAETTAAKARPAPTKKKAPKPKPGKKAKEASPFYNDL